MISNESDHVFHFLHMVISNSLETVYLYTAVSLLTELMNKQAMSSQIKVTKHLT